MLLLLSVALAGDLNFAPDRPGVGESTGAVGAGHVMVEGGLAAVVTDPLAVGTSGITARIGLDDPLELRVRVPDLVLVDGELVSTSVGVGAKVAGEVSDRWSLSLVPELFVATEGGDLGGTVNGNLAFAVDDALGLWLHTTHTVVPGGMGGFFGGGVGYAFDAVGVYVNGGHGYNGDPMIGAGGWLPLGDALQLDAGVDITLAAGDAVPVVLLGASGGF